MRGIPPRVVDFFFAPTSTNVVALVRMALGVVLLIEAYSWSRHLDTWFAVGGLASPTTEEGPTLFAFWSSEVVVRLAFGAFVAAAVAVLAGFLTRAAVLVSLVLLISFVNRMPYVHSSAEQMLINILALFVLCPAGSALSVDRWLFHRNEDFWSPPQRPPLGLRLIQIQMCVIYLSTALEKLRVGTWRDGTALYYGFVQFDTSRLRPPQLLLDNTLFVHASTWGMIAFELAFVVLVWPRRTRPYVLVTGVIFHSIGALLLLLGVFSYVVGIAYLSFVYGEWADRLVAWLHRQGRRREELSAPTPLRPRRT